MKILYQNNNDLNFLMIFIDLMIWYPKVWIFFQIINKISCIRPKIEFGRIICYFLLWSIGLFCEFHCLFYDNDYYFKLLGLKYIQSVICIYIYENFHLKQDLAHLAHHNIVLLICIIALKQDVIRNLWLLRLCTIPTYSYISSVFSSMRKCITFHRPKYSNKINKIYRYSFVLSKPFSIFYFYYCLHINFEEFYNSLNIQKFIVFLIILVHFVQIYFTFIITKQLCHWKKKIN